MTVCAKRTDDPGSFTSCYAATGNQGCLCGAEIRAELLAAQQAAAASEREAST